VEERNGISGRSVRLQVSVAASLRQTWSSAPAQLFDRDCQNGLKSKIRMFVKGVYVFIASPFVYRINIQHRYRTISQEAIACTSCSHAPDLAFYRHPLVTTKHELSPATEKARRCSL
jgi:hypothetical protein